MKKKYLAIAIIVLVILAGIMVIVFSKTMANQLDETGKRGINIFSSKLDKLEAEAQDLFEAGDMMATLQFIEANIADDKDERLNIIKKEAAEIAMAVSIKDAWTKIKEYKYKEAYDLLQPLEIYATAENEEYLALLKNTFEYQTLVPYTGTVEHIFYHPLIVYPEMSFDGDSLTQGFADYFVTVPEFKEIMKRMYENDYILIDIGLIYDVDAAGKVTKPELMLPAGKKPLIMSIDDLNFYKYMKINGMVHGFDYDENGDIVTYTDNKDGVRTYSDDNEIVPIIDRMIKKNPGFAFGGHKGIIASTGYEGTLGFATNILDAPDYPEVLARAQKMANHLKEAGWSFACHSYGHNSPAKKTYEYMSGDTGRWRKEVGVVVGDTDVYIYPFGELIKKDDPKHIQMKEKGFRMFCGVQATPYIRYYEDWALQQRRNVDGIAFGRNRLDNMIDMTGVVEYDIRPKKK